MNFSTLKQAVVAIMVGGLMLLALKMFGQKFGKSELALMCVGVVFCGLAAFRFQQCRERRQLESMRNLVKRWTGSSI